MVIPPVSIQHLRLLDSGHSTDLKAIEIKYCLFRQICFGKLDFFSMELRSTADNWAFSC